MFAKKYFFSIFISFVFIISFFPVQKIQGTSAPTVESVTVALTSGGTSASTVDMIESSQKTIFIHGSASDGDGCSDINIGTAWQATVYRTGVAGASACASSNNNCYQLDESVLSIMNCSDPQDLTLDYEIQAQLEYYSDPTDSGSALSMEQWTAFIQAKDVLETTGNMSANFEINSLLAMDTTVSVDYGTVNLGAQSSQQMITFTNAGNRAIDLDQITNGDMVCNGVGSLNIPAGNVHWSFNDLFSYVNGQGITVNTSNIHLNLTPRTSGNPPSTKNMYLVLEMPLDGVGGVCGNIINFNAKADV